MIFLEAIFSFEKTFFKVSVQDFCHCLHDIIGLYFSSHHVFLPIIVQNYDL